MADAGNNRIRRISPEGMVSTVAGSGEKGYLDGPGDMARFDFPNDLAVDTAGNLYVCEFNNHTVRQVTPEGLVSTWVGNGSAGSADGPRASAGLNRPGGIAIDGEGNLYMAEWGGQKIRKISVGGEVSTVAGDGKTAQFANPGGIGLGGEGLLYVVDSGNQLVRKVVLETKVVPTHYVSLESPNPTPPYITWTTAATNIQDAIDVATPGEVIVVTNGVYETGGRVVATNLLVNRVVVDMPLTLRSVNGPQFTLIQGYQVPGITNGDGSIRCAYLCDGAKLSGFTLTKGARGRLASSAAGMNAGVAAYGALQRMLFLRTVF